METDKDLGMTASLNMLRLLASNKNLSTEEADNISLLAAKAAGLRVTEGGSVCINSASDAEAYYEAYNNKSLLAATAAGVRFVNGTPQITNLEQAKAYNDAHNSLKSEMIIKDTNKYINANITLQEAIDIQMALSYKPQIQKQGGGWTNASRDQVSYYIDPSNFINDKKQIFQFYVSNKYVEINESELKNYLNNKELLSGKESTFIAAGKKYNMDPIYLASHSVTETGGNSELFPATYNGKTVYNAYGILAYDVETDDKIPFSSAKEIAYNNGWFTPEAAIDGGAGWIAENYEEQGTIYEKRWNPKNPGTNQYATAINWAYVQAEITANLYDKFPSAEPTFRIPQYNEE